MNLLGGLHQLLNAAGNTVHNDVVQPIQRDIARPIAQAAQPVTNGLVHLWQLANPNSGANQGARLQQQASNTYQFTPAFNRLVGAAHPSLNNQAFGQNGNLAQNSQALGESFGVNPSLVNKIQLAKTKNVGTTGMQDALVHEGLHQQWAQASDQQKNQFFQAYNQLMSSNNKEAQNLKSYLTGSLSRYKESPSYGPLKLDAGGVPISSEAYNNIGNLSPEIQNEVHSFIPEFYANINANNPLTQYYSQYIKPSGAQLSARHTLGTVANTLPRVLNQSKPDWLTQQAGQ